MSRLLVALLVSLTSGTAYCQTAIFMGTEAWTYTGTSPTAPYGMARDLQGNLWVSTYHEDGLTEILAVNGVLPANPTTVQVSAANLPVYPAGLAVDAAGDLWIADAGTGTNGGGAIKEIAAVGGVIPSTPTVLTIVGSSAELNEPWGLAFDASGDLWFCDARNNAVKEIVAVGGVIPSSPTINTVGSGWSFPTDVWVDAQGNVFVGDTDGGKVLEMVGEAPPAASTLPANPNYKQIGSGFVNPEAVAVDSQGNVWVEDDESKSFYEVVAVGGSIPANPTIITFTTDAVTPSQQVSAYFVSIDGQGNIFLAGTFGSGNLAVNELSPSSNSGQIYVGVGASPPLLPTSGSTSLLFGFLASTTINAPGVYTQGAPGQDFQDAGTGTCTTNGTSHSYSAGDTCTVNVTFKPLYPGTRLGAVELSSGGNVLGTGLVSGDGVAPMINFGVGPIAGPYAPSSITQVGPSNNNGYHNSAVDGNHNVYLTNDNGEIDVATAASNYQTVTMIAPAGVPFDIVVDGAGDVIWNDFATESIQEAVAVNGSIPASPTIVTLASGLFFSIDLFPGLAVDGYGDIYFSDFSHFYELVAVNGAIPPSATARSIPISKLPGPMAFDQYNNLFFEDAHGCFDKVSPVNGQIPSSPTVQQVYCGSLFGYGMAVDAAGNLWWADISNPVNVIQAVNGVIPSSPKVVNIVFTGSALHGEGMGLDDNGNLFVSWAPDESPYFVDFYDFRDPPSFTWSGNTNVGQTANPTNYAFAANMGNAPLSLGYPASGTNPSINPNWTWATGATGACPSVSSGASSAESLAVSAVCGLAIDFHPTTPGAPLTGQLTFTDDDLYVETNTANEATGDPTQSIALSGTAVGLSAPTISWTPASPITYGTALGSGDFNAQAFSGATNISADGFFTYFVGSVNGTAANSSTILPGGNDTLCVQWTPSSSYSSQYNSTGECLPIRVNAASTSISWNPSSTTIIASSGPTAGQFDASAMAGETNVTGDGALTYSLSVVGGTMINVGSTLAVGPVTICVQWNPSSSFSAEYNSSFACQNFTVINTQPTTTTVSTNANPVFFDATVTFTATVTPTSGSIVPTGTVTFDDNGTAIGTGTLSASGSGASAIATLTTSSLAIGSHPITASYPGDTNNQSSTTATALPEVVEDFAVAANAPGSVTVEPGAVATFTFTVSPVSPATTFPAAISLTAAGLPTGATYTLTPASIAAGAGSTPVTLTVTTPVTALTGNLPPQSPAQGTGWPLMALALLLLPLTGRWRRAGRRLNRMLSLLLLVAAGIMGAAALEGCGGGPSGYFGQAPATSTITVTGTSGTLSHNASVSLTVE